MLLGWQGSCTHTHTLSYKPATGPSKTRGTTFKALSAKQTAKQTAKQAGKQAAKQAGNKKQSASKKHTEKASSGSKPKQEPKQHKWQRAAARNQPKAAVEVRRGDFAYRQPPWRLTYDVTAEQLKTAEDISEVAAQACHECQVKVAISASPLGAGYFLKGAVQADVPLSCSYCMATFTHPVKGAMTVWLDPSLDADDDPEDPNQVAFPSEMQAVGLDSYVNDAIFEGLPAINMCGRPDCTIKDAELGDDGIPRWRSRDDDHIPASQMGQFAVLQKLKDRN